MWHATLQKQRNTSSRAANARRVEMLFADLKRILKLDRLRLRGLSGASDEFTLSPPFRICADWPSWPFFDSLAG